jgi:small subunit ribosomal protein S14
MKKNKPLRQQRRTFRLFEYKSNVLRCILKSKAISSSIRLYCTLQISKNQRYSSRVRFNNHCIITGRARGVYRFAKLSRLMLRDNNYINKLPGLKKSYW